MQPDLNALGPVRDNVEDNLTVIKNLFGEGINLIQSRHDINHLQLGISYIDSIADKDIVMKHVLTPIIQLARTLPPNAPDLLLYLKKSVVTVTEVFESRSFAEIISGLLNGDTVLFIDQADAALMIGTRKVEKRSVEAPENESTVFGSQESFTDDIKTNCSLIIKRLPVPNLKIEEFTVGTLSCTKVKLVWLEGIANPDIISEARARLRNIDIDLIDGVGTLFELIEDRPLSIFPAHRQTERPDLVARGLSYGRFAIICSNSPFAMVAPYGLLDTFKTMDDYEDRPVTASYLRLIRCFAFGISIFISGLYLSFVTYNQSIIPTNLALNIAQGRQGVPFPSVIELLILTAAITIIREAGLRMPSSVGYFVGTLAAVIIGQAVVTAGYVSASLIIVVAISTISSFAISATTMLYPARFLNYFFILLAGFFGIFGIVCGIIFLLWYLITLESFGMPYLYPLIPFDKSGMGDLFIRRRYSKLKSRMKFLSPFNRTKVGKSGIK